MKKSLSRHGLVAVTAYLLQLGALDANASLLQLNSSYFGQNAITRDTSTSLNWLDVNLTQGKSFNEVKSLLATNNSYAGFRFATAAEVGQLFQNAGIPNINSMSSTQNVVPSINLIKYVGATGVQDGYKEVIGFTSTQSFNNGMRDVGVLDFVWSNGSPKYSATTEGWSFNESIAFGSVGSWLVKSAPVNYGLFIGSKDWGGGQVVNFDSNAQQVANAFLSNENTVAKVLTGDITVGSDGKLKNPISVDDVYAEMKNIRSMMNAGDTFTLYINNHGYAYTKEVDANGNVYNSFNDYGQGDDVIHIGNDVPNEGLLTDNKLADMLTMFDGFSKTIFLDACHSGGFWGGADSLEMPSAGGSGIDDLNQLTNIALFAAASEDGWGHFVGNGLSFWGQALVDAFNDEISLGKLGDYLDFHTLWNAGFNPFMSNSPVWYSQGLGDEVTPDLSLVKPFFAYSNDYDLNRTLFSAVPEPGSLMLIGLGFAGIAATRRRRG